MYWKYIKEFIWFWCWWYFHFIFHLHLDNAVNSFSQGFYSYCLNKKTKKKFNHFFTVRDYIQNFLRGLKEGEDKGARAVLSYCLFLIFGVSTVLARPDINNYSHSPPITAMSTSLELVSVNMDIGHGLSGVSCWRLLPCSHFWIGLLLQNFLDKDVSKHAKNQNRKH